MSVTVSLVALADDAKLTVLVVPLITTVPIFCTAEVLSVQVLVPVPSKVKVPVEEV